LRVEEERSNKKKFATIDASKNQLESLKKKRKCYRIRGIKASELLFGGAVGHVRAGLVADALLQQQLHVSLYSTCHLSLLKRETIPTFFSIASIRKGCDTHAFSRLMERPRPVPDKQTWSLSSTQQTIYICWTSIMVRACCYFSGGFKKLVGINNSHHSLFSPNIYFVCLFV
jgi:hypothetical protein